MIKKIYTILIIIYPILSVYMTPILTFSVADILLLLLLPFIFIDLIKEKKVKVSIVMFGVLVYIILQLLIESLIQEDIKSQFLSTLRIILYYFSLALFTKNEFLKDYGVELYKKVAVFVSAFLILQIILSNFGIYIQGTIPGLPVTEAIKEYNDTLKIGNVSRFRSLFNEPSHFAIYVLLAFGFELLGNKESKNKTNLLILGISLLLSASSTAIITEIIIILLYILKNFKKISKKNIKNILLVIIMIILLFPIYSKTTYFKVFMERTIESDNAIEGRFGNYGIVLKDLNYKNFIFGRGILKIDSYIPAFPRIFFYFGIIGMIFFSFISVRNFTMLKETKLITWIIMFILIFPTEFVFGQFILLYGSFLLYDKEYIDRRDYNENKRCIFCR